MFFDASKLLGRLKRKVRGDNRPLAIHVEAQHLVKVHRALIDFLRATEEKPTLFCITPVNKAYVEGMFGRVNGDFSETLKVFYQQFAVQGFSVQLHVHVTRVPETLNSMERWELTEQAYRWMKGIGVEPSEVAFGWFADERGCLPWVHHVAQDDYRVIHDYNLVGAK